MDPKYPVLDGVGNALWVELTSIREVYEAEDEYGFICTVIELKPGLATEPFYLWHNDATQYQWAKRLRHDFNTILMKAG